MIKRIATTVIATFILCSTLGMAAQAAPADLSPTLEAQIAQLSDDASLGLVIVAFRTDIGLSESHLNVLRGVGITGGHTLPHLGMVAAEATVAQVKALSSNPSVRSIWSNDPLEYYMDSARVLAGVDRIRRDAAMTKANGGIPFSGRGNFTVMVIDSGVDATHEDLKFGSKVVQNVQTFSPASAPQATVGGQGVFTPLLYQEDVPNTDQSVGHGTHCAGIIGGTGVRSGGRYAGVAPGAKLIGAGLGAGLFVLNALAAWDWADANQFRYNIRVISNSYGSFAAFNPNDPINIASKKLYDRNVVIVFAGANSGPGKGTWNRYAKAPWVIGVANGHKEGGLVNGSSRGLPREERLGNATTLDDFDAPTITAPGSGREFASSAGKFTTDIVSVRSTSNISANGGTDDAEIPAAFIPFYTQISGTSMATPFVAGTIALMIEADPTLANDPELMTDPLNRMDDFKRILTSTATRMPNRQDYEVGAGFINSYAAVDMVLNRSKGYGSFLNPTFNTQVATNATNQPFSVAFNPAATPGPDSTNTTKFNVEAGTDVLDVFANVAFQGQTNPVGVILHAPNGATYSSGVGLPALNAPVRQVVVNNPLPGQWTLEVRGVRGLTASGVSTPLLPTAGVAPPSNVTGTITKKDISITSGNADVQSHAAKADIELALISRRIDAFADGSFRPNDAVTREDFARTLALNVPLRQTLSLTPKFTDVSAEFEPLAQALTARGSTLRDFLTGENTSAPSGLMSATGSSFNPTGTVSRTDLAVAFVRALGLDAEAKAKANTDVTFGGQPVIDNAQIPGDLRGYVQIAIDKGFLEVYPAEVRQIGPGQFQAIPGPRVEPNAGLTRAALATKINLFVQRFVAGN